MISTFLPRGLVSIWHQTCDRIAFQPEALAVHHSTPHITFKQLHNSDNFQPAAPYISINFKPAAALFHFHTFQTTKLWKISNQLSQTWAKYSAKQGSFNGKCISLVPDVCVMHSIFEICNKIQLCHHKIVSFIPKFRWQGRRLQIQQLQQLQQQVQCGQGCLLLLLLQGDRGHGGVDDGGVEDGDHEVGRDVEADFFALGPLLCPEIQEKVKGPDLVSAKELCRLFHSESMVLQRLQESSREPERKKRIILWCIHAPFIDAM